MHKHFMSVLRMGRRGPAAGTTTCSLSAATHESPSQSQQADPLYELPWISTSNSRERERCSSLR